MFGREIRFQSTLPRGERRPCYLCHLDMAHFNPRSHEGSDRLPVPSFRNMYVFQSTLPRGERHSRTGQSDKSYNFNPRSHEGSDAVFAMRKQHLNYFNPRSHEGSDSAPLHGKQIRSEFQSTLPRGERPSSSASLAYFQVISIHAPTRGATVEDCTNHISELISIHAPTRGATKLDNAEAQREKISIHAPTRGATSALIKFLIIHNIFQSTLPRGERLYQSKIRHIAIDFNPRSHEGSDSNFRQKVLFSLSKNCLKYLILTTNYFN